MSSQFHNSPFVSENFCCACPALLPELAGKALSMFTAAIVLLSVLVTLRRLGEPK